MDKILKRDEFVNEVYNPMIEQKQYEELKSINEGLLKTLFGVVKNLFKKDWDTIKGDKSIIDAYRELDDKLSGFSIMKMSKKDECNKIRQALVDFACDWYDLKMNKSKESEEDPKPAKSMKFKNETLKSNLEACEKKIKDIAGEDQQMLKWAQTLLDDMKVVINKSILADIQDEEAKKELEKQIAEDLKDPEKVNKMMEEWQNEQLNEIKDERKRLISDSGADPASIKDNLLGDKAIQNLCGEFDKFRKVKGDNRLDLLKRDKMFGLGKLFTDSEFGDKKFKTCYKLMDSFYTALAANDVMDKFKETPGPSVQAMCISINSFIKNCIFGGSDYGKQLPLMAKCAIVSDGTLSYNLPLNDKTGDEAGNYFTDIVKMITDGKFTNVTGKNKGKVIELPDDFANNSKTLLNKIISEAKSMKEEGDKKYNEQLKKLNLNKKES